MEWNNIGDWIGNIFTLFGGVAGIFAVVVIGAQASGKKWIDHWFEKKNKSYQKEIDKEIQNYKSELDAKNKEIQNSLDIKLELLRIKEARLHTTRLDAIRDIYVILINMHESVKMLNMTSRPTVWSTDEEIGLTIVNLIQDFAKIWLPNKLFFSKDIADDIEEFMNKCYKNADMNLFNKNIIKSDYKLLKEELDKLKQEIDNDIPPILGKIETNFREIIGVETTGK